MRMQACMDDEEELMSGSSAATSSDLLYMEPDIIIRQCVVGCCWEFLSLSPTLPVQARQGCRR